MTGLAKREPMFNWPDWFSRTVPEQLARWRNPLALDDWFDREGMRLEETREDGELVVKAELPGVDPDKDIEITVANDALTIAAERKEESKEDREGYHRSEFRYGKFLRRISLPPGTTDADVKATYVDGILEVRVPVAEASTSDARKIEITRG